MIIENLKLCGCGDPEKTYTILKETLEIFDNNNWEEKCKKQKAWEEKYGDLAFLTLYFLNSFDLLEHGGSVGGSWLSQEGKTLVKYLNENGCDPDMWDF